MAGFISVRAFFYVLLVNSIMAVAECGDAGQPFRRDDVGDHPFPIMFSRILFITSIGSIAIGDILVGAS